MDFFFLSQMEKSVIHTTKKCLLSYDFLAKQTTSNQCSQKKKSCCMLSVNWCQLKPRNLYTLPIINTAYGFSNIASILLEKKKIQPFPVIFF